MTEPTWMHRARRYLGLRETPGKATAPVISRWLLELKAWCRDDERLRGLQRWLK